MNNKNPNDNIPFKGQTNLPNSFYESQAKELFDCDHIFINQKINRAYAYDDGGFPHLYYRENKNDKWIWHCRTGGQCCDEWLKGSNDIILLT